MTSINTFDVCYACEELFNINLLKPSGLEEDEMVCLECDVILNDSVKCDCCGCSYFPDELEEQLDGDLLCDDCVEGFEEEILQENEELQREQSRCLAQ